MLDVCVFSDRSLVRQLGTMFENPLLAERQKGLRANKFSIFVFLETAGWRGPLAHS